MSKLKIYFKSILLPVLLGTLIGIITSGQMDYMSLEKPFLSPPGIVFPTIWTILYTLMGISYAILKSNSLTNKNINFIYYFQLIINLLWSVFFFNFKWRLFSFLWILLLIVVVIVLIIKFYKQNKTAGLLQIPYLIWLLFAAYLNLFLYILNK